MFCWVKNCTEKWSITLHLALMHFEIPYVRWQIGGKRTQTGLAAEGML